MVFSSDHGDMQGAHGGMHEKWHVAYEEALHVPFIVSSPLLPGGARELDIPTNHADLIPTLLGLAGIDHDEALARLQSDHTDARPLVGRDLSDAIRAAEPAAPSEPVLFTTDDEISEGSPSGPSPFQRVARRLNALLDHQAAQPHRDRHRRGRRRRRAAPREVLPLPRQPAVLDRARRARRAPARPPDRSPSPSPSPTSTSSTTSPSTRSRSATSRIPATPTTAPARCSRRCSHCSSSSSPPSASPRRRARCPATGRPRSCRRRTNSRRSRVNRPALQGFRWLGMTGWGTSPGLQDRGG